MNEPDFIEGSSLNTFLEKNLILKVKILKQDKNIEFLVQPWML